MIIQSFIKRPVASAENRTVNRVACRNYDFAVDIDLGAVTGNSVKSKLAWVVDRRPVPRADLTPSDFHIRRVHQSTSCENNPVPDQVGPENSARNVIRPESLINA